MSQWTLNFLVGAVTCAGLIYFRPPRDALYCLAAACFILGARQWMAR